MPALAAVAFAESSFFPIPPDAMIIPMVLAQPQKAWRIAAVATVASVIGGLFGYAIGYYLYETVGQWLIDFYGLQHGSMRSAQQFNEYGLWIILIKGATPIPYKIVTIASGIAQLQHPGLHPRLDRHSRRPILHRRGAAAIIWRADPRLHRKAADAGDDGVRAADRRQASSRCAICLESAARQVAIFKAQS